MGKHVIPFSPLKEEEREEIDLAFSKKKADERKEWLRQFRVSLEPYIRHDIHMSSAWDIFGPQLGRDNLL